MRRLLAPGAALPLLLLGLVLFPAGCGDPPGAPCEIVGSGFQAHDSCRHRCLSRWQLTCPDGERITPGICTGAFGCEPGSCPAGQLCYADDDPFDDRSFCIPEQTCGPLDVEAIRRFELERFAAQAAVKAERAAREARRAKWRAENPGAAKAATAADAPAASTLPETPTSADAPAAGPPSPTPDAAESASSPALSAPGASTPAPPLPCSPTAERAAFRIPTPDGEAPFDDAASISLRRGEAYSIELPHGWRFALLPGEWGWSLRVFDRVEEAGRIDLSAGTPPLHGPANAREIEGWHFRNAANSGPNEGDVNAPQALRLFEFSTDRIGTDDAPTAPPGPGDGRGWLRLLDYALTPPAPGERAGLTAMRFQACLTWPHPTPEVEAAWEARREASRLAIDALSPTYRPEELEEIGACGLDLAAHPLDPRIRPRRLVLDLDGDEVADSIYPIRRAADDVPMLALCRSGTRLDRLGPEHPLLADPDLAHLVRALEAWRVVPGDHGPVGLVGEAPWPKVDGDVVLLERIEKQVGILYWKDGALQARSLHRFVEP
ncbi:MAG: hypothetical protein R3F21_14590 [Myxococcota bacterium]